MLGTYPARTIQSDVCFLCDDPSIGVLSIITHTNLHLPAYQRHTGN